MLRKPNAQELLDLIHANEEASGFDLSSWFHSCGTHGCLVGNHLIAKRSKCDSLLGPLGPMLYPDIAPLYGVSHAECLWLFSPLNFKYYPYRGMYFCEGTPQQDLESDRDPIDREAAINRVRKFLYYKLRKWELLYEEDGRVRESSRRAEGDHHVCRNVLRECVAV
jgi:hypothetical protein